MTLIADILLAAGALAAAIYCIVLSRRLSRFSDLEKGMGGAIAVLSVQVDDMTKVLSKAQGTAQTARADLEDIAQRAEGAARRLELLLAAMHDLPETPPKPGQDDPPCATDPAREENTPAPEAPLQWRSRRKLGRAV